MFNFFRKKKIDPEKYLNQNEKKKNVIGACEIDGKVTFLVEKKEDLKKLDAKDVLPKEVDGFKTDVIEVGKITASSFTGVSGAGLHATACTIGCVGYKDDEPYFLSNAHCNMGRRSEKLISPSRQDGGRAMNQVGTITWQNELNPQAFNTIDVLIAKANVEAECEHTGWEDVKIGETVFSRGRTSGERDLVVLADNVAINVGYASTVGRCRMVNQVMLQGVVRGGDSGSIIEKDGKVKGLIFASNNKDIGFANRISNVVRSTGLDFYVKEKKDVWEQLKYFKKSEFKEPEKMDVDFLLLLDKVREDAGIPFKITSSFRTPEQNRRVNGSSNSAHLRGLAVDISARTGRQKIKIVQSALKNGISRIGVGSNFIHLDVDKSLTQNTMWTY